MKIIRTQPQAQRSLPRILARAESGQAIVILVLAMVALIGFTALAIDGGNAFFVRRNMQNAADGGVVGGIQGYLATYNSVNASTIESAIVLAAHNEAESNSVEDTDGTTSNCVNSNVYIWYINEDGEMIEGPGAGDVPTIQDSDALLSTISGMGRMSAGCSSSLLGPNLPAGYAGIQVITLQEFDTFLAGVVGIDSLAAQGGAAAIVRFEDNGCNGDYAIFASDTNEPNGSIKLTGVNPSYDVDGDFYAADNLNIAGSGVLRIEGDLTYVDTLSVSGQTDVWIGELDDAGLDIPADGDCSSAVAGVWTFYNTGIAGDLCYESGAGYQAPYQVSLIEQPFTYDLPGEFGPGGEWADDAVGVCGDSSNAAVCWIPFGSPTVTFGNKTFEKWGDDYYYLEAGSVGNPPWSPPDDTILPTGLPTGIYYLYGGTAMSIGNDIVVNELLTFVTDDSISLTGGATITVNPSTVPWKPYGGFNGSGVLMGSSFTGVAISFSGAGAGDLPDMEGIVYAPDGDCNISGSQAFSGAFVCKQVDSAGSTGSMTFNPAFCPPPRPTIIFKR